MHDKMEMLRKQLEEKILNKSSYEEIYKASIELDEAINLHYTKLISGVIRKQQ